MVAFFYGRMVLQEKVEQFFHDEALFVCVCGKNSKCLLKICSEVGYLVGMVWSGLCSQNSSTNGQPQSSGVVNSAKVK